MNLPKSLKYPVIIVIALWAIQVISMIFTIDLSFLGILPRTLQGLVGIITAPFIHADITHLMSNTIIFFILCWIFFSFYKKISIFVVLWVLSGILTWIIGRQGIHVGISGIVYALASFMIVSGFISKNMILLLVSIGLIIFYNGLLFGILPTQPNISWEGHLCGAISGIICGFKYNKIRRNEKDK